MKNKTINFMRPISQIANEIRKEWKNPYFGAKPYLQALLTLEKPTDRFQGMETAESLIRYFLANAQTFRGPKAKELKQELRELLKVK